MIVPDRYRMSPDGQVLERTPGTKGLSVRISADGGTSHDVLPSHLARRLCLGYSDLRSLHGLARRCDEVFGPMPHDVEWAFENGHLFMVQRRPVTRRAGLS
jgi:hypothetical protein